MKNIHDHLAHWQRIDGPHAGFRSHAWLFSSILLATAMILALPCSMAGEEDGTYKLKRISGSLYIKGTIKPHYYSYWWGLFTDDDFYEKHAYPIPPEGMLAAALGQGIDVKNKRIRVNLADSRAEIVRVIQRDPRLRRVMYFEIQSLPDFRRFKSSESGVLYAGTRSPLRMEVGLTDGSDVTVASALADYRAKIRGKRLLVKVTFRGNGGPLGEDHGSYHDEGKSYDIEGTARISALRK